MVNEKIYGEHIIAKHDNKIVAITLNKDYSFKIEYKNAVTGEIEKVTDIYKPTNDDHFDVVTSRASDNVGVIIFWAGNFHVEMVTTFAVVDDDVCFEIIFI